MNKRVFLLCAVSGILLALSFPPLRLGFLAYIGLVPFLFLIDSAKKGISSLKYGLVTGLVFNLGSIYWIAWDIEPGLFVIIPSTIIVALILSLFFAAFAVCLFHLRARMGTWGLLSAPLLWASIEYVRSIGVLAFPWNALAYSQSYYLPLIQLSTITSVYGISCWIVLVNALLLLWTKLFLKKKASTYILGIVLASFVALYVYGKSLMSEDIPDPDVRVALVQGNIDPLVKWDKRFEKNNLDVYVDLTRTLGQEQVDLIVWPETAIPVYLAYEDAYKSEIQRVASDLRTPILTGAPHIKIVDGDSMRYYNSAFLFSPKEGMLQEYSKMHLVPFSEHLPFQSVFPFLEGLNFGQADFSQGTEYSLFRTGKGEFAVLICFESIFPNLAREFAHRDVDFLVNITNDAWFGKTSAPFQHARIAVFRAIENRLGMARCANTGVSMFIDPYGRVSGETTIYTRDISIGKVSSGCEETFYTRHGDVFAKICCILSAAWLLTGFMIRRNSSGRHILHEHETRS